VRGWSVRAAKHATISYGLGEKGMKERRESRRTIRKVITVQRERKLFSILVEEKLNLAPRSVCRGDGKFDERVEVTVLFGEVEGGGDFADGDYGEEGERRGRD
jgi:hypothetical protein